VYEGPSLGRQASVHGEALWETNPSLCCAIRKVAPLGVALSDLDGWITGRRRDQGATRAEIEKIEWDTRHELWKATPLADWSDADVWAYVRERDLPVNGLHDEGYASIGCTHCTQPGEGREGRWSGTDTSECGMHS
jgi:phosphoadenosine phosphosulfate reductase